MIAVINTGEFVSGMVKYNHNKLQDTNERTRAQFIGTRNILNDSLKGIISEITTANQRNKSISRPNLHISLSFPKEEVLDNNKMLLIADTYMHKMGYDSQPYAVYRHYDRPHPHIHIVSTQISYDGKKISDSNLFLRSINHSRSIEKELGLIQIERKESIKNIEKPIEKGDLVDYISFVLDQVLHQKPTTLKQFDYLLSQYKVSREKEENGQYFVYAESDFKRVIKSNELYESFPYDKLLFLIEGFKKEKQSNFKSVMGRVFAVLNAIDKPLDLESLKLLLHKKSVKISFKTKKTGTDIGRINGIKFTDIKSGITYSSSEFKIKTKEFLSVYLLKDSHVFLDNDTSNRVEGGKYNGPDIRFDLPNEAFDFTDVFKQIMGLLDQQELEQQELEDFDSGKKKRKKRRKNR